MTHRPFVRLWHGAPQLGKKIFLLCPRLTSWQMERDAHPSPEVAQVIIWGGAAQAPHDHKLVGVVSWLTDGQLPENLAIGPHNVVSTGPQLPPLPYHLPRSPVLAPCEPSQKEVTQKIFQTCRCHHRRNLFVPFPSSLQMGITR